GSIFRRRLDGRISDLVEFTITGYGPNKSYRDEVPANLKYRYSAKIYLSAKDNTIVFKSQHLQMSIFHHDRSFVVDDVFNKSVDIETTLDNDSVIATVIKIDKSALERSNVLGAKEKLSESQIEEIISEYCRRGAKESYLFEIIEHLIP